jgi:hypothetical protein
MIHGFGRARDSYGRSTDWPAMAMPDQPVAGSFVLRRIVPEPIVRLATALQMFPET